MFLRVILPLVLFACAAPGLALGAELRIVSFYGAVEILVDEAAANVTVEVDPGARLLLRPDIRVVGDVVLVRGGRERRNSVCEERDGVTYIQTEGVPEPRPLAEFPKLTVRAPVDTDLTVDCGLVIGRSGPLGSTRLTLVACSNLVLDGVEGRLQANLQGSSSLSAGETGSVQIDVTGTAGAEIDSVFAGLRARISGSGRLQVGRAMGDLILSATATGSVDIADGETGRLSITTGGSARVAFGGTAASATVTIGGSGDVTIAEVQGTPVVNRRSSGQLLIGPAAAP